MTKIVSWKLQLRHLRLSKYSCYKLLNYMWVKTRFSFSPTKIPAEKRQKVTFQFPLEAHGVRVSQFKLDYPIATLHTGSQSVYI